jgi:Fe-S cluster biosynthesis and repair protein YggX
MYRYLSRFGGLLLVSGLLGCSSTGGFLAYQPEELAGTSPFNLPNVAGQEIKLTPVKTGGYQVPVVLNGKITVMMHLDSGADTVLIPTATAMYLKIQAEKAGTPMRALGFSNYTTAANKPVKARNFVLHSLEVGNRIFRNVNAAAWWDFTEEENTLLQAGAPVETAFASRFLDEELVTGLLGQPILDRLGQYTIDNERNMLVLAPSAMHVPKLAMYPSTSQKSLQAVHHWDVLAEQEASRIVEELGATKAAFFLESEGVGAFGKGFHDLLTGHLVDKGRIVLSDERAAKINDAYRIKYKVQVVSHSEAAGTEVLVTTQVSHGERIMLSSSNVYYLQDQHKKNYKAPKSATPMKVVSG